MRRSGISSSFCAFDPRLVAWFAPAPLCLAALHHSRAADLCVRKACLRIDFCSRGLIFVLVGRYVT